MIIYPYPCHTMSLLSKYLSEFVICIYTLFVIQTIFQSYIQKYTVNLTLRKEFSVLRLARKQLISFLKK